MSREYRSNDEAARAKIVALEDELRDHETKLSSLLFSRTPAGAFAPIRARAFESRRVPERSGLEMELNLLFAGTVGVGCWWLGAASGLAFVVGVVAYLAFWQAAAARRAITARIDRAPTKAPEDVAALAALVEDRNARIETLDSQIAKERAACNDLRKRIQEAELLVNEDDFVKTRESSR